MPHLHTGSPNLRSRLSREAFAVLSLLFCLVAAGAPADTTPPATPRDEYNSGTAKLRDGKLREAEAMLESALRSQDDRLQPSALYNLGHVRFSQGVQELKKEPGSGQAAGRARSAAQTGANAIQSADEALAGSDLQKLIDAYTQGRGARKELKQARAAVRRAMDTYGAVLAKWQRAEADFKSTLELKKKDAEAKQNVEIIDRSIAKLVDSLREMQQTANAAGDKNKELGEKLKQLKGRIPDKDMPPGSSGEDEEDEDQPMGPQPGQKEGPTKDGQEMLLSPEQAGWLLDSFKLDSERRLPMGEGEAAKPKDRNRSTW